MDNLTTTRNRPIGFRYVSAVLLRAMAWLSPQVTFHDGAHDAFMTLAL
jgi:hypothetical protein